MKEKNHYLSELKSNLEEKNWSLMRKFSSETKSLYSDLPDEDMKWTWKIQVPKTMKNDPEELIAGLIILSKIKPYWYTEYQLFCAEQVKKYNYQGKWILLHKLLKLNFHDLILYRITEIYTGNAYFGNINKRVNNLLENFSIRFGKCLKPRPTYAQRKRGYNDHGSRKNPHEIHDLSSVSGPNPEKLDFSDQYKKRLSLINFLYG